MEVNRLFICHLEAEHGTYPEYCVQDVCCGIYKQPNHLISVIGAFLISLLIIAQACGLIYAWFTFREEHSFSPQASSRETQGQKKKLRNPGKEKEGKINTALVKSNEKDEQDGEDEDGGKYENGKSKTSYEVSREETIGKDSKKSKNIEVSENKPTRDIESTMINEASESISTRSQKKNNTHNEGKETPSTEINHELWEDHNRPDLNRSKKISNKTAQEKKSSLTKSEQEGSNDEYDDDDDDDDDDVRVNKHTSEDIDSASTIANERGKSSSSRIGNMNSTHNNETPTKNNNDPGKEVKSGSTAYKIINTPTDGKTPSSTKPKQEEEYVDDDVYGDDDYENGKDTLKKFQKGS